MNNKTHIIITLFIIVITFVVYTGIHKDKKAAHLDENATNVMSSHANRESGVTRLAELELLGCVPQNATLRDWQLAEKTKWWGKKLDPQKFWRGKVLWLDKTAIEDAKRHGRSYPPIPPNAEISILSSISDEDLPLTHYDSIDGYTPECRCSQRECAFWDRFAKEHPRPPEDIEREQLITAKNIMRTRHLYAQDKLKMPSEQVELGEKMELKNALKMGYPAEAFTYEALWWSYVLNRRNEFQSEIGVRPSPARIGIFMNKLYVNMDVITNVLSRQELQKADMWKYKYIERLHKENIAISYVNAYVEAWHLKK